MGGFFNLDGPFQKWGTEIADVLILSILWFVCSVPIVTIGASTTALFYVYGKKVRGEDPYIAKMFFKSFKDNFKQATIITFMLGLLWFSSYLYYNILTGGQAQLWVKVVGLFFMVQVLIVSLYVFPVLSRFHMPIKNIIISSFVFGNRHIFSTIICALLFGISILVIITPTPFSLFSFGIYALVSSVFFQNIFTKHIKAIDAIKEKEEELKLAESTEEMTDEE